MKHALRVAMLCSYFLCVLVCTEFYLFPEIDIVLKTLKKGNKYKVHEWEETCIKKKLKFLILTLDEVCESFFEILRKFCKILGKTMQKTRDHPCVAM